MINISFFTKYTSQGATSRYRSFLFLCKMINKNYNISVDSFLDSEYLYNLYNKKPQNKFKIVSSYFKRLFSLLTSSPNLIIEYELFPYLPYWIESIFLRNKRYILNFDDNVWDNYKDKLLLKSKYDRLVQNANAIIVANDFLFEKSKKLNENIIKIPTVIDLKSYEETSEKNSVFTLVWIGTPITYRYILSHASMFQELATKIEYKLCIIASKDLVSQQINGVNMQFIDWTPENEVYYLKQGHVGIMPLDKDNFSQGKSAFKLIQYMAAGLPIIGSPIGENKVVIQEGMNGYCAAEDIKWIEKISLLANDKYIYDKLVICSKECAYDYSIQKYLPLYIDFVSSVFDNKRSDL